MVSQGQVRTLSLVANALEPLSLSVSKPFQQSLEDNFTSLNPSFGFERLILLLYNDNVTCFLFVDQMGDIIIESLLSLNHLYVNKEYKLYKSDLFLFSLNVIFL